MTKAEKDFYLHERALASYLEKDWFDHFVKTKETRTKFTFASFDPLCLYSNYHEKQIEFLNSELTRMGLLPESLLEVGSSLGRDFYEVCDKIKSVQSATLIEPSQNLSLYFNKIFFGQERETFNILKGNVDTQEVQLDTRRIRATCELVTVCKLACSFQNAPKDLGQFDLVLCANVIDQCEDPLKLIEFLKAKVRPGGVLLLSCTYQWQSKYIGNAGHQIKDINELFDSSWNRLNETNLSFQCRVYERHWLNFLSHIGIFQKN